MNIIQLWDRLNDEFSIKSEWGMPMYKTFTSYGCQNSIKKFYRCLNLFFSFENSEPVTSVAPKMTSGDDLKRLRVAQNEKISLLCPAQSYPVGAFR